MPVPVKRLDMKDKKVSKSTRKRRRSKSIETIEITQRHLSNYSCYGVLGIGVMGTTISKSLLRIGMKVNIWHNIEKVCEDFITELEYDCLRHIVKCSLPIEVIHNSDIIFNCIPEKEESKALIEILKRNEKKIENKGWIDMSGIDPKSQVELGQMILEKGGKYLEVRLPLKKERSKGDYIILTGGDASLFAECERCFEVFGGTQLHFEQETGYVTKLGIVLQLIKSSCLLSTVEATSVFERFIPFEKQDHIKQIVRRSPISSEYVKGKFSKIFREDFEAVDDTVKDLGRDIKIGLDMADDFILELPLIAMMSQFFKQSQKLGYGDKDSSAVFMRTRQ